MINKPKRCSICGKKSETLLTARNWKGEMKWVCRGCYYRM